MRSDREALRKTKCPVQLRKHFRTRVSVIIDCLEVFIEGLSVSFILRPCDGHVSDKFVTEHCGILSNILHDIILADRGFDISCCS